MELVDQSWDKPVMLLSADWSYAYLPYIGFEVESAYEGGVKEAARFAVRQMIGSKESYYYVDFTPERLKQTRQTFLRELKRHAPVALAKSIEQTIGIIVSASEDQRATTNLLSDAVFFLTKGVGIDIPFKPTCGDVVLDVCRQSWREAQDWYSGLLEEADDACWTSAGEWDSYLRGLTDLPSVLADYLYGVACHSGKLPLFWSLVKRRVGPTDLRELNLWFREAAAFLAPEDRALAFPPYMDLPAK
jgi:hypothetical protein